MNQNTPYIISIAGFDPSGGAGLLADMKTIENIGGYGLGICSAITFQNESEFAGLKWVTPKDMLSQLTLLQKKYPVKYLKIGLIQDENVLCMLIRHLKKINNDVKIIWDPVIKASAGYIFHEQWNKNTLLQILKEITLITPNTDEIDFILELLEISTVQLNDFIKKHDTCDFLVKAMIVENNQIKDVFFDKQDKIMFKGRIYPGYEKHGSGCVFSSSVTTFLAKGYSISRACKMAKKYVEYFLLSSKTKLGLHHLLNNN